MSDSDKMMKRQQVLADFGEFAIRSEQLDEVLTEACRLVGDALGTGRAKVLEIQKARQELLVRAGVGWAPDVVGTVRLRMGQRSSESYAIEAAAPVVSQDVAKDDRFDIPEFMKRAGVMAMVNVPIFVPGQRPYGVLQVDDTKPRDFGDDEIQFLRTYAMILGPVIDRLHLVEERARADAALRESEERQTFQLRLSDALARLTEPIEIQAEATRLIAERFGVGWCYFNEFDERQTHAIVLRDFRQEGLPSMVGVHDLSHERAFLDLVRSGTMLDMPDLASSRLFSAQSKAIYGDFGMRSALGAPLMRNGRLVALLLAADTRPRAWSRGETELLRGAAERTWIALQRARVETAVRQNEERQAFLLRFSDTLRGEEDVEKIEQLALDLLAAQLSSDRAYITTSDYGKGETVVPAEVRRAELPALLGVFPHSEFPESARLVNEGTLVIEDVATTTQLSPMNRQSFEAIRIGSLIGVGLRKGVSDIFWTLAVATTGPRKWNPDEIWLVEQAAERTLAALARATAEIALRESEERFRQFANASEAGLWIRNAETLEMEFVSPAVGAIYGVETETLLGDVKQWASLIVPEDRKTTLKHLESARGGKTAQHEFRIQRVSDGAFRWIRNTDFPLQRNGHVQRMAA